MKALSIHQPWASLIVLGVKRYETRDWETQHRGPLAIHASRTLSPAARALCACDPVRRLLKEAGYASFEALPRGAVLGTVELTDCVPVDLLGQVDEVERVLGDYRPTRFAWALERSNPLAVPLPLRGWLGVFSIPDLVAR